jgi:hypothetical protein
MVNGARLVGPTIAGLLIAAVGEGICFLLNALSFSGSNCRPSGDETQSSSGPEKGIAMLSNLKEGFKYAFGFPPIRAISTASGAGQYNGDAIYGVDAHFLPAISCAAALIQWAS